jgi:hypothetical protein
MTRIEIALWLQCLSSPTTNLTLRFSFEGNWRHCKKWTKQSQQIEWILKMYFIVLCSMEVQKCQHLLKHTPKTAANSRSIQIRTIHTHKKHTGIDPSNLPNWFHGCSRQLSLSSEYQRAKTYELQVPPWHLDVDSNTKAHKGKNILTQSTSTFPTAIITCNLPKASQWQDWKQQTKNKMQCKRISKSHRPNPQAQNISGCHV